MEDKKIRVIVAKPGLDGHDREPGGGEGPKGRRMEVIYTVCDRPPSRSSPRPYRRTQCMPEILSGAHEHYLEK